MAKSMDEYQYYSVELTIDRDGLMVARTGIPVNQGDPSFDLGAVSGMALGLENGAFVTTTLVVAACPAGKCYKKVNGRWGCYTCP